MSSERDDYIYVPFRLGLYGVGKGVAGWSAKNFETKLKKGKKETVPVGIRV